MKKTSTAVLCLLAGITAFGQQSLDDCKEKARSHYPVIRQYDLIEKSREYTLANASRAWLPQVSLSAQASLQSDVAKWPEQFESMLAAQGLDMPGLRKDQYKVQIDIRQNIWDGGKSKAEKEVAEMEAEQSRYNADVEMYSLESRIEDLYFGILLMQEQQRQIGDMMQRLRNNLSHVEALVENGVAMQADADAVEVQLLSANQSMSQVRAQEKSFRKMLGLFIGEPVGDGDLEMPEAAEPMGFTPERPELKLFDARIGLLEAKSRMSDVSVTPKFDLFAQGWYGYPGLNMFENMMSSKWSLNGIIGIRMSWNISGFYTLRNSRRQIRNSMEDTMLQRDIFLFNNRLQAESGNAEIARLREALKDDDRIVMLRGNVRKAAEAKLAEGTIDTNGLLDKISEESAAIITRSTHEIELMKAIYELKHTLNR